MSHVQIPSVQRASIPPQGQEGYDDRSTIRDVVSEDPGLAAARLETRPEAAHDQSQPLPTKISPNETEKKLNSSRRYSTRVVNSATLRDSIEAQFGLEILLKHKELRLIDQEFAKCQVALEQLRRCQIIPYPAMSSNYDDLQAATSGSGAAFDNRAPYASPWGITQGPYTCHYERWLIPDSAFDDTIPEIQTPTLRPGTSSDRPTRGAKSELRSLPTSTSRSQRGSKSTMLKALPHGYAEPKEEKGPCIVKRSRDGKMVKLVCLDCRRSNFSSVQGFINHCRIAHSRQFLNHDTAIDASGEEIDAETEGSLGESNSSAQTTASAGLVHPLIRSAHLLGSNRAAIEPAASTRRKKSQPRTTPVIQRSSQEPVPPISTPQQSRHMSYPTTTPTVAFNPSPRTPHLSALIARTGREVDLNEAVSQATTRIDVDVSMSSDEEDTEDEDAIEEQIPVQSRSTRGVIRGGDLPTQARSVSPAQELPRIQSPSKFVSQRPSHLPRIAAYAPHPISERLVEEDGGDDDHNLLDHQSPLNLSPNTIESHTAPSLVSDDGDYENTHSESESPSDAEADDNQDHYIHAEYLDHDDMDLGGGSSHHHLSLDGKPHDPDSGRQTSSMRPPTAIHHENRHVTFASPQRRRGRGSKVKKEH